MKRLFLTAIAGAVSLLSAPIVTVIPTIGPNPSSANFAAWAANAITGLQTSSSVGSLAQQYNPLANGASVNAGQFISTESLGFQSWQGIAPGPFAGEQGNTMYFSVIVQESNPALNTISLSQLTGSETYLGTAFFPPPVDFLLDDYSNTRVGLQWNGTSYTTINFGSGLQPVNTLYYVGLGFSWQALAGSGTNQDVLNQNIAAIEALVDRTTSVCYSIGTAATGCGNVNVEGSTIPEPGTWALIGAGLAGVGILRRRR